MFHSTHILSQEILYQRRADDAQTVLAQLCCLKNRQREFAVLPVAERMALLQTFAERLAQHKTDFTRMICEEVGRCWTECAAEVEKSIGLIRYYAEIAPKLLREKNIPTQARVSGVSFAPLGVVFAVMPWNYPVWQILRFAIPALCVGNACLVKPAPSVARVSAKLMALASDILPLQAAWLAHDDVESVLAACDAFAFTGSTETGRHLAAMAGRHLKKSVLELGGSNAFIVLPDTDILQAAKDACYSRFRDAGQSCNAAKRVIVCEAVADEFLQALLQECAALKMGDPMLPDTTLATLHRADIRQRVHEQVQDAMAHGARLLCGGTLPEGAGWFYPATVLDNVSPKCRLWREEVFGPALGVIRVSDAAQAVALANDSPFGLGASIYTRDHDLARHMAKDLQVGSVFVNRHTSSDLRLPFGGVKHSGFGRELSEFGLYEFVNVKTYWQK